MDGVFPSDLLKMFGTSTKNYYPKDPNAGLMVMNPMVESVKKHLI